MRSFPILFLASVFALVLPAPIRAQQSTAPSAEAPVAAANEVAGEPRQQRPGTDLLAIMSGKCSTLKVAGRDFACRKVAYVHSVEGRASFTIALEDFADENHIISFSGENGQRSNENLYDLTIDRMLINSSDRPKIDGLPVPVAVSSSGRCVQLGNFASGHVLSVVCSATDKSGQKYELRFEPDDSPIAVRRVNPSAPSIRQNS